MYFRLNPECYFIKGVKLGAIYDIISGEIYHLDECQTDLLSDAEKNIPIVENSFFDSLNEKCLGNFYECPPYIQKLREGPRNMFDDLDMPILIEKVFLEITNNCNINCSFCGGSVKRLNGCMGCNKFDNENKVDLNLDTIIEVIDDLERLNCQNLFIKGGDITLNWDVSLKIINYAKDKFLNVIITLHESQYCDEIFKDVPENIKVIIQVDTLNHVEKFDKACLILLMSDVNMDISNLYDDLFIEQDYIFNNDDKKFTYPSTDYHNFTNNLEYHPCLSNSLAITSNGNVLPCIMMRNDIFGNVYDNRLYEIIHDNFNSIDKFWKLNLDKINQCKDCEFRYACDDCRALENSKNSNLFSKTTCNYNPNAGNLYN